MTKRLQYPSSSDGWCAACGEGWGDAGVHCSECGACHTRVWADESHDPSPEARLAAARPEDRLRAEKWQAAIARRMGAEDHDPE